MSLWNHHQEVAVELKAKLADEKARIEGEAAGNVISLDHERRRPYPKAFPSTRIRKIPPSFGPVAGNNPAG
jgi:hypothetical protein